MPPSVSPSIPPSCPRPPAAYASLWRHAGKSWPRDLQALSLMAVTGWSARLSLAEWLVSHDPRLASIQAGSILRLWRRLGERDLIRQHTQVIDPRAHVAVAVVELTALGRDLLYELGVQAAVSEWQRLRLWHQADAQPRHTAMVLLAAHYFRKRGYRTVVCPEADGLLAPDLLILHPAGGQTVYVEVEAPGRGGLVHMARQRRKWEMQASGQGFVAFCALNPRQRGQKLALARRASASGIATDLLTLHAQPEVTWASIWGDPLANAAGRGDESHWEGISWATRILPVNPDSGATSQPLAGVQARQGGG
ncbi:MAG: hypothetical protein K1X65_19120 [Caldilineales bacterium]|nr:hypothetical protein [Caldilineales bacterium]